MKLPLVSVYIPTFKRNAFLREAIESVLKNGYDAVEIIVSDDDPEQSALKVVEEISDQRIRYVSKPAPPDKVANWQNAVLATKGVYCFKLDDDDLVEPGFISGCVNFLEQNPSASSVYTGYVSWEEDGRKLSEIDQNFFGPEKKIDGVAYIKAVLANEGGYPLVQKTAVFYRRAVAEQINFYELACEDFAFGASLALYGEVGYVPTPLYIWRKHGGNNISNLQYTWTISQRSLDGLKKVLIPRDSTLSQKEWLSLVNRCEKALPLFYLQASFQVNGTLATWSLWKAFRTNPQYKPASTHFLYLVFGSILPKVLHRQIFYLYRQSTILQALARWLFTSKA